MHEVQYTKNIDTIYVDCTCKNFESNGCPSGKKTSFAAIFWQEYAAVLTPNISDYQHMTYFKCCGIKQQHKGTLYTSVFMESQHIEFFFLIFFVLQIIQ